MGLGIENSVNAYNQNYRYQQNKTTGQANHLDFNKILSAKEGDNTEKVQKPNENSVSKVDTYTEYLKAKYGNIMIQNVGSDQKSMDSLGTGTYGMNNIVIAPNVLETMANDPKKAAYYEKMIQDFFASQSTVKAQMAVGGFEIQSYGMVIHPDGTAHYYVCGDVSPEKKAKIEAQMKAEDEEKAKRRRQYLERSEEAAEKRRQIEEINMQKSKKDAAFNDNISAVNVLSEVDRAVAIAAYENIANTFNENIIKKYKLPPPTLIPINTVSGKDFIKTFKVKKINIEGIGIFNDVIFGISKNNININGVDCILNIELLEGKI